MGNDKIVRFNFLVLFTSTRVSFSERKVQMIGNRLNPLLKLISHPLSFSEISRSTLEVVIEGSPVILQDSLLGA